jgi:hypothetical protein
MTSKLERKTKMVEIKTDSGQIGLRFGLWWVLLTLAGLIIGFVAGFALGEAGLDLIGLETALGTIVVLMQWLALRRIIKTGISWVLAALTGFLVSSTLHTLAMYIWKLPQDLGVPLGALGCMIAFVLGGTLSGIMQQRILRHHVPRSGWWVLASAAGWGLSMAGLGIFFQLFHTIRHGPVFSKLIHNLLAPLLIPSIILGVITAGTLIWLMRQPEQQMLYTATQK